MIKYKVPFLKTFFVVTFLFNLITAQASAAIGTEEEALYVRKLGIQRPFPEGLEKVEIYTGGPNFISLSKTDAIGAPDEHETEKTQEVNLTPFRLGKKIVSSQYDFREPIPVEHQILKKSTAFTFFYYGAGDNQCYQTQVSFINPTSVKSDGSVRLSFSSSLTSGNEYKFLCRVN